MPDLCRFKHVHGKLYCWDKEKKQYFNVNLTPVTDKAEFNDVISAYMEEGEPQRIEVYEIPVKMVNKEFFVNKENP